MCLGGPKGSVTCGVEGAANTMQITQAQDPKHREIMKIYKFKENQSISICPMKFAISYGFLKRCNILPPNPLRCFIESALYGPLGP